MLAITHLLVADGVCGRESNANAARGPHPAPVRTSSPLLNALPWLVGGLLIAPTSALADRYELDPRKTEVRFSYTMAYALQRGRFTKVSGIIDLDEKAPERAKVNASIAAASISTGAELVDSALKGEEFFNVEKFPLIAFRSSKVQRRSETTADVSGEITVNGITKPVVMKVSLEPRDDPALKFDTGSMRFIAKTSIKRSAFKMTGYSALVEDNVDLEIEAIVRPSKGKGR